MTAKTLMAFGHSHLSALMRAYKELEAHEPPDGWRAEFVWLGDKTLQPNFELIGKGKVKSARQDGPGPYQAITARLRSPGAEELAKGDKVRALSQTVEDHMRARLDEGKPDAILLACMGNEYNSLGLLQHPEPFDFDLPGSGLPVEEGVAYIQYSAMKAQLRAIAERNVLLFWRFFNDVAGDVPIYLVPPPPPIASEEHILSYPGAFADRAKSAGISPVALRRKLWMLYLEILRDATHDTATRLVDLPEVIFTDGCLSRQFWKQDPTHGNSDYGMIILDHVTEQAFAAELES